MTATTQSLVVGRQYSYIERYDLLPKVVGAYADKDANPFLRVSGTNAAEGVQQANGGILITTAGGAADQYLELGISGDTSLGNQTLLAEFQPFMACMWVVTSALVTTGHYWFGMQNAPTSFVQSDQTTAAYIDITTGIPTAMVTIASVDATPVPLLSAVPAVGTVLECMIDVDDQRRANFYLNGNLVHTSAALTAGATMSPNFGSLHAVAATAQPIRKCYTAIARNYV